MSLYMSEPTFIPQYGVRVTGLLGYIRLSMRPRSIPPLPCLTGDC